jgi:hypothetical protein
MRPPVFAALVWTLCLGVPSAPATQSAPTVQSLLEVSATYLDFYHQKFSGVVSEEEYEQTVHGPKGVVLGHRTLKSDLLLVNTGLTGWLCFRDVFEVDGKPVRDRTDRLMNLFTKPVPDAIEQAEKIREEGSRFNIGSVSRTVNDPTMALPFLARENQRRSDFQMGPSEDMPSGKVSTLRFKEDVTPRLIHTGDDSPASGRFWLDAKTGRVLKTELSLSSEDARGTVTVEYAAQPKLGGLWVPVKMTERYAVGSTRTIECVATYTNFRQFNVQVC